MFTQRSSSIGRLQVEKPISLSSIKCYINIVQWFELVHSENDLPVYCCTCLTTIAAAVLANHGPRTHIQVSSQHETILADLNQYMAKTLCLLITLTEDAILKFSH